MLNSEGKSAMQDQDKSKQELIEELAKMRRRVAELEVSLAEERGESDRLQQTDLLWRSIAANTPVSDNGQDCWAESAASKARQAKALELSLSCPWS
jgi:hypothetical protein